MLFETVVYNIWTKRVVTWTTLIVATVTTRTEKKKNQPTHVLVDSNPAFKEPSMILLEQIFTIDKNPASNALWAMPARLKCSALIWLCWSVWL